MRKEFQQKLGNINKTQEDFDMAVIKNFDEIVERVKGFPEPMRVIVAAAQDEHTLQAIKHAQEEGIAKPPHAQKLHPANSPPEASLSEIRPNT